MAPSAVGPHINPAEETIGLGLLTVRFSITRENSSDSIAACQVIVTDAQCLAAPADSHDHYGETIYGSQVC